MTLTTDLPPKMVYVVTLKALSYRSQKRDKIIVRARSIESANKQAKKLSFVFKNGKCSAHASLACPVGDLGCETREQSLQKCHDLKLMRKHHAEARSKIIEART